MPWRSRSGRSRLRSNCRGLWRRNNSRTRGWFCRYWTRCRSNLHGFRGRRSNRFWNCRRWRRSGCRRLGLHHSGGGRRNGTAWLGDNWCGRRSSHNGRWWWRRRNRGGLHASCARCCFLRYLFRDFPLLSLDLGFGDGAKMFAHSYRGGYFNGTGMRFFLGYASLGQIVNNRFCLDLKLASQFINTNLIRICHCPPGPLLLLAILVRNLG
jgi:hypothetical protein